MAIVHTERAFGGGPSRATRRWLDGPLIRLGALVLLALAVQWGQAQELDAIVAVGTIIAAVVMARQRRQRERDQKMAAADR